MPTKTSNGTGGGDWGTAGTWAGGVAPVDDDTVVIASGDTVIFNVDTSGFANGINGMTITGALKVSTSTSSYMKMKAATNIAGAGTFNIGENGDAIPFAVKHTTALSGGAITGTNGLVMGIYAAEPSIKYVRLSENEAIGQTVISVDTDVTGDIWTVGDRVYIVDTNGSDSEEYTIAEITSNSITLSSALTAVKNANAVMVLLSRNVTIIKTTGYGISSFTANKLVIAGGLIDGNNVTLLYSNNSQVISGGVFYHPGSNYITNNCANMIINGGVFVGGSVNIFYNENNLTINNGVFITRGIVCQSCEAVINGGIFTNCTAVISTNNIFAQRVTSITNGTFSYCTYLVQNTRSVYILNGTINSISIIIYNSLLCYLFGGTFINVAYLFHTSSNCKAYNLLTSGITTLSYDEATSYLLFPNEIINIEQVEGAYKALCHRSSTVTSQSTIVPSGYTQANLHTLTRATEKQFYIHTFTVYAGKTANIEVQLRKNASMTYLPRVYLMMSIGNPLSGVAPVDTFTMTDSTNTWETDTFTVVNSTDYDQDYTLWFVGQNATGNVYSAYDITTAGGAGGGAVSIQPIQSAVRL